MCVYQNETSLKEVGQGGKKNRNKLQKSHVCFLISSLKLPNCLVRCITSLTLQKLQANKSDYRTKTAEVISRSVLEREE